MAVRLEGEIVLPPTASRPMPSPRGDLLVYYLPATGNVAVLADREGRECCRLPGESHWGPVSWSPDGTRLCYYTASNAPDEEPEKRRVVIYSVADGSTRELALTGIELGRVEPLPQFVDRGAGVRVYTARGVYRAKVDGGPWVREETAPGVGLAEGPFAVSPSGLMARRAQGGAEVVAQAGPVKDVRVPGEVTAMAFDSLQLYLALACREGDGYALYLQSLHEPVGPALVDRGEGEVLDLNWSPEGRFLAYRVAAPGRLVARFLDRVKNAVGTFAPDGGLCGLGWIDPFTVIALVSGAQNTRGCLLGIGDPPRVEKITVEEWHNRPART
ncbi:MAG: hypothetical protein K6T75_03185 [Acetobacteraceae bacterium]|nr:hypothetical protein [Acetobacteraceae bacterium]